MAYDFKQELRQDLRLTQQLVMTPQLQLAIRLLQLSRMELLDAVREELESNPVLEEEAAGADGEGAQEEGAAAGEEAQAEAGEKVAEEMDWEAYLADYESYKPAGREPGKDGEDKSFENFTSLPVSLKDHLTDQLGMSGLGEDDLRLGAFIIGNISDDGYLRVSDMDGSGGDEFEAAVVEEIGALTGLEAADVERVMEVVQGFDPAGVGARDVRECLIIQARRMPVRDTVVEEIIEKHLDGLAGRNYKAIAKAMALSVEEVYEAASFITTSLCPMPGSGFGPDNSRVVIPDIYVHKVGGEYVVSMNEDGLPKLRVSPYYRKMLAEKSSANSDARGYVQERLRSALWLIKSVHQRQRTLYRVAESIVKFQFEFLDKGLKYLKPLVLKAVAEDVGVHESTVSRVTTSKYIHTPRGTFELKYFFTSGMSAADGGDITSEYIKEMVRDLIESENSLKPMSDQIIVDRLKELGVVLARRTVTKYREELGYQSSNRRKAYF